MKTTQPDRAVLQNLYGNSRESMIEIFSEFLTSYAKTKKALFSAFESGNLTSLKRVLHYHAPSFMYIGFPDVTTKFKNLALRCSQADSHYSLSKDFAALMETVEESWQQSKNEMECLKREV
jgi:hypothetical protein